MNVVTPNSGDTCIFFDRRPAATTAEVGSGGSTRKGDDSRKGHRESHYVRCERKEDRGIQKDRGQFIVSIVVVGGKNQTDCWYGWKLFGRELVIGIIPFDSDIILQLSDPTNLLLRYQRIKIIV